MYLYLVWNRPIIIIIITIIVIIIIIIIIIIISGELFYYISGWYIHEPKAQTAGTYPGFFSLKHAEEYCYSLLDSA